MWLVRQLMWTAFKRAAADPKVRHRAGQAVRAVDKKMNQAADRIAQVAAAKDPAREAGRVLRRLLPGSDKRG